MEGFDPKQKSKGLGDTIAKFTHATKLDKVADAVAKALGKDDCGCNERRKALNEIIPYTTRKPAAPLVTPTSISGGKTRLTGGVVKNVQYVPAPPSNKNTEPLGKLEGSYIVNKSFTLEKEDVKFKKGEILNINKNHPLYMYVPGYYYNHIIKKLS